MKFKLFTLPNIITCLNLVSGCLAIERAFHGDFLWAFLFVVIAAVFDFLDGFFARLLKAYSEIGKELDSLADMVSFGAAPAFVLFNYMQLHTEAGWLAYAAFIIPAFSALRLAKFNLDTRQNEEFIGLPTPANTLLIVSYIYAAQQNPLLSPGNSGWALVVGSIILSVLLVSEIPMFSLKFKRFGWRGNELRYIFLLCSAVLLAVFRLEGVPVILSGYIVVSVIRAIFLRQVKPAQ